MCRREAEAAACVNAAAGRRPVDAQVVCIACSSCSKCRLRTRRLRQGKRRGNCHHNRRGRDDVGGSGCKDCWIDCRSCRDDRSSAWRHRGRSHVCGRAFACGVRGDCSTRRRVATYRPVDSPRLGIIRDDGCEMTCMSRSCRLHIQAQRHDAHRHWRGRRRCRDSYRGAR
jgi:hypothetical protein